MGCSFHDMHNCFFADAIPAARSQIRHAMENRADQKSIGSINTFVKRYLPQKPVNLFSIAPIPLISTLTTSPFFNHGSGFRLLAIPLGVPVMTTVPFRSVAPLERCSTISLGPNTRSPVLVRCLSSPFTHVTSSKLFGSVDAVLRMVGPMGAKPSKPLA